MFCLVTNHSLYIFNTGTQAAAHDEGELGLGPTGESIGSENEAEDDECQVVRTRSAPAPARPLLLVPTPKCLSKATPTRGDPMKMDTQIFTVGWKSIGAADQRAFPALVDEGPYCLRKRVNAHCRATLGEMVFIDCRPFHDPCFCKHTGENIGILQNFADSDEFPRFIGLIRDWASDLKHSRKPLEEQKQAHRCVMVCKSGIHRSVAGCRIALECMKRAGFHMLPPRHLSSGTWKARDKCVLQCRWCRLDNEEKAPLFDWIFAKYW